MSTSERTTHLAAVVYGRVSQAGTYAEWVQGMEAEFLPDTAIPHVGVMLRQVIEDAGYDRVVAFAEKTGINYAYLNEVLNGNRRLSVKSAHMAAVVLDCDPTIFLNEQTRRDLWSLLESRRR